MKIRDDNGLSRGIPTAPRPVQGARAESGDRTGTTQELKDRVELSDQARALHVAKQALKQLPEVREDKVASLKEQIQSGTYQVAGSDVAARMLGDGFLS